jgi:hypothetical protein
MTSNLWLKIVRCTALLVLLNVGLGLYACMKDVPHPINRPDSLSLTRNSTTAGTPACNDDCDSCVCCASLIIASQRVFTVALVLKGIPAPLLLSSSDPDPDRTNRPPRA